MKRAIIAIVVLICATTSALNAQNSAYRLANGKVGYINTDSILVKIPAYASATKELDNLSNQYKQKIESDVQKIETLYQSYQSQKQRLTETERAYKEQDIITREKEVKELQKLYFGPDGYLQKKSEELLSPIKEKVQAAIDKIAKDGDFMIIFDLAAMQGVAYYAPGDNLNPYVLKLLGLQ